MEPNKLENDFRNKLNQREIQPSEKAWDRLDAMLSVTEKKKPKRTWMYIAASFLGFLLVGTLFFKQSEVEIEKTNQVITLEENKNIKKEITPEKITEKPFEAKQQDIVASNNHQQSSHEQQRTGEAIKNEPVKNQILAENVKQEVAIQDEKALEVAQQIMEMSQSGKQVTDQEINDLLNKAKRDIASQRLLKKSIQKVDATALLLDAEQGLDNSFKQRVFDLLKEGYKETKIFVAERNN